MSNKEEDENLPNGHSDIPAGEFSQWLRSTEASLRSGNGAADVPCGSCRGCCRSSMFVHIRPEETQTIQRIPRKLLFPAPGLPKGHLLMGYNDKGECPMLIGNECSIYEDRPQTCRDYDCRVFAATGISVDAQTQPEIARRVQQWAFTYESESSREEHRNLKETAAFLEKNRDLFPQGSLPGYPVQLAACAVEVNRLFFNLKAKMEIDGCAISDTEIAQAILAALNEPETPLKSVSPA
jgi:Fe-S-cluster containining protein